MLETNSAAFIHSIWSSVGLEGRVGADAFTALEDFIANECFYVCSPVQRKNKVRNDNRYRTSRRTSCIFILSKVTKPISSTGIRLFVVQRLFFPFEGYEIDIFNRHPPSRGTTAFFSFRRIQNRGLQQASAFARRPTCIEYCIIAFYGTRTFPISVQSRFRRSNVVRSFVIHHAKDACFYLSSILGKRTSYAIWPVWTVDISSNFLFCCAFLSFSGILMQIHSYNSSEKEPWIFLVLDMNLKFQVSPREGDELSFSARAQDCSHSLSTDSQKMNLSEVQTRISQYDDLFTSKDDSEVFLHDDCAKKLKDLESAMDLNGLADANLLDKTR